MAKLYVFGIGGTGARVIKSLILLLASGVKLANQIDTLVPITIDPDSSNGDQTRTSELLENYSIINKQIDTNEGFFSTPIKNLVDLSNDAVGNIQNSFKMLDTGATQNGRFSEFLGYSSMPQASRSLIDLLFSEENLKADMTVGFKGNPNIGSVVLNKFKESPEYSVFLNSFTSQDSIFIISSIFGGTGAAGFPLLLRNLRQIDANFPNSELVANSKIGAISVLPYFKVQDPSDGKKKTIDSSSFMGKSKAALDFYNQSIFENNQLNSFYSIGEESSNFYEHNDGEASQKNNAHFIELASAIAIIDFSNALPQMTTQNSTANKTHFKEFGIEDLDTRSFNFKGLGRITRNTIVKQLSQFILMTKLNEFVIEKEFNLTSPWYDKMGESYKNNGFHTLTLHKIEEQFKEWIIEMSDNDISFSPFNIKVNYDKLLMIIDGYNGISRKILSNKESSKELEEELNKITKSLKIANNKEKFFIEAFNKATEVIVEKILNI